MQPSCRPPRLYPALAPDPSTARGAPCLLLGLFECVWCVSPSSPAALRPNPLASLGPSHPNFAPERALGASAGPARPRCAACGARACHPLAVPPLPRPSLLLPGGALRAGGETTARGETSPPHLLPTRAPQTPEPGERGRDCYSSRAGDWAQRAARRRRSRRGRQGAASGAGWRAAAGRSTGGQGLAPREEEGGQAHMALWAGAARGLRSSISEASGWSRPDRLCHRLRRGGRGARGGPAAQRGGHRGRRAAENGAAGQAAKGGWGVCTRRKRGTHAGARARVLVSATREAKDGVQAQRVAGARGAARRPKGGAGPGRAPRAQGMWRRRRAAPVGARGGPIRRFFGACGVYRPQTSETWCVLTCAVFLQAARCRTPAPARPQGPALGRARSGAHGGGGAEAWGTGT
jgi:hypothetical protein